MVVAGECAAKNGGPDYGSFFDELGKLVEDLDNLLANDHDNSNCTAGGQHAEEEVVEVRDQGYSFFSTEFIGIPRYPGTHVVL